MYQLLTSSNEPKFTKNDELTHKKTIDSKILKSKENNFAKFVCIPKFAIEMYPLTNNTLVRCFKTRIIAWKAIRKDRQVVAKIWTGLFHIFSWHTVNSGLPTVLISQICPDFEASNLIKIKCPDLSDLSWF